jgi:DNA-binding NarL/FixJ family response regulator
MTTVLLVDDHPLVRSGLNTLISTTDDLEIIGEAGGGEQAVSMAGDLDPDVILMDLSMPGMDGVEATRQILKAQPQVRVVVLTSFADQERVADALAAGAVGYLLKDTDAREVLAAIRSAAQGHAPWTREWRGRSCPLPRHGSATRSACVSSRCCGWWHMVWPTNRSVGRWASLNERSRSISVTSSAGSA